MTVPPVGGPFGTIVADPPWRYRNRTGKSAPEHRRLARYATMDGDAIRALPVADWAADRAHLYLWCTAPMLPVGLSVVAAWGFAYVSTLVWHKVASDGTSDMRSMGFHFRVVTEFVLYGTRGGLRTGPAGRRMPNLFAARRTDHSAKPAALQEIAEACSPGPYLELFARRRRPGWSSWGDSVAGEGQGVLTFGGASGGAGESKESDHVGS